MFRGKIMELNPTSSLRQYEVSRYTTILHVRCNTEQQPCNKSCNCGDDNVKYYIIREMSIQHFLVCVSVAFGCITRCTNVAPFLTVYISGGGLISLCYKINKYCMKVCVYICYICDYIQYTHAKVKNRRFPLSSISYNHF